MKKVIILLLALGINYGAYGQIPKSIKKEIIALANESDKLITERPVDVKSNIIEFLREVPSEDLIIVVLDLMRENSSSQELKELLDDFEEGKIALVGQVEEPPKTKIFINVNLIDGSGSKTKSNMVIVCIGNVITDILNEMPKDYDQEAIIIDLKGKYVMPGLIDAHVHMATDPSYETYDLVQKAFKSMLGNGIVGVRDMGGDGRALAYYKRQVAAGDMLGPDLYFSTILAGPNFFTDPRIISSSIGVELGTGSWAHKVTADTDLTSLMQRVKGIGSTGVKLYYDIDADLTKKIAEAAKKEGLKVWSHWYLSPASGWETVKGGVEVVSHAEFVKEILEEDTLKTEDLQAILTKNNESELYKLMKEKGTILDATLAVYNEIEEGNLVNMSVLITKNAFKAGVKIAAGSDVPADEGLAGGQQEFRLLAEKAGMNPAQVLNSAAIINAKVISMENEIGVIAKGKQATFLVFEEDPLQSVEVWATPYYVVKKGEIYSGKELRKENTKAKPLFASKTMKNNRD